MTFTQYHERGTNVPKTFITRERLLEIKEHPSRPTSDEIIAMADFTVAYGGMESPVREYKDNSSIPMLLWCPECGERHVDKGKFAEKPHHTHACQYCGHVWRPAKVNTVGVQFLPGYKDEKSKREPTQAELYKLGAAAHQRAQAMQEIQFPEGEGIPSFVSQENGVTIARFLTQRKRSWNAKLTMQDLDSLLNMARDEVNQPKS